MRGLKEEYYLRNPSQESFYLSSVNEQGIFENIIAV
jgi:hypothetical protein